MLKRKLMPPPAPPPYVVETYGDKGWRVEVVERNASAARRKVKQLTAVGYRARSKLDPRSTVSGAQLAILYELREQLPSRWRKAIRDLWQERRRMVAAALDHGDKVEILRRMSHTHGPNWLKGFWFVWD